MTNNWMDIVRKKLYFQEKKVPDHIWITVQKNLPQKRKRNKFYFSIFYSGIVLIGTFSLLWFIQNVNPSNLDNSYTQKGNVKITNRGNHPILKQLQSSPDDVRLSNELQSSSINSNLVNGIKNVTFNDKRYKKEKNISQNNNANQNKNLKIANSIKREIFEPNFEAPNNIQILKAELFNMNFLPQKLGKIIIDSKEKFMIGIHTECYNFNKNQGRGFAIELYAGPGYNPYLLTAKTTESQDYRKSRINSESSMVSGIIGIRGIYTFSKIALRAGLEYQHIHEKFKYRNTNDYKVIEVYTDSQLVRKDTIYGARYLSINNYHRMLHIPISMAYEFNKGNIGYSIQPGVGLNIWSSHKGIIFDHLLRPKSVHSAGASGGEVFKTKVGIFAFMNFQVSKRISPNIKMFVEPGIMYFISTFNNIDYILNQKYISYHVKLGLNYTIR